MKPSAMTSLFIYTFIRIVWWSDYTLSGPEVELRPFPWGQVWKFPLAGCVYLESSDFEAVQIHMCG